MVPFEDQQKRKLAVLNHHSCKTTKKKNSRKYNYVFNQPEKVFS